MKANPWDRGSKALGSALTMAVAVALFTWLGYLADVELGTKPLFLILGLALGVVGGFIHVVNAIAPDMLPWGKRPRADESPEEPPESPAS